MFNPRAKLSLVPLGGRQRCLVVDDALLNPEELVRLAGERRTEFRPIDGNAYPGVCLAAPDDVVRSLGDFFALRVRRHFDARRLVRMHGRLSLVTLPPEALRPFQWLCHRDGESIDARQSIQASILYLFQDERLGGTSFYELARSISEIAALFADSKRMAAGEFTQRYAIDPGYIQSSNSYFRCIGSVAARWNRMIFYDGSMLHSGDVDASRSLSADPLTGRLTLNGFFTSLRNLI